MLRIQPHLPVLWRTPTSCQLGSVSPIVILPTVMPPHERLLDALRGGVSRVTFDALARQQGFSREEASEFLTAVKPALEQSSPATPEAPHDGSVRKPRGGLSRVDVVGDGPGQGEIRYVLDGLAQPEEDADHVDLADHADLVVNVGSFLIAGETAGTWLRRDIPHLLVTFDEQGANVGPLVLPGRTPCAHCVDLHRRDADPSWVALASQLLYREHPKPSAALRCAVATEVMRFIVCRDDIVAATGQVRVRADDLERSNAPSDFHPDCQCRFLQENVTSIESRRANQTQLPTTA